MQNLCYHEDWLAARERLTTWWNGGDIGRAALQITVPREQPWEAIPEQPEPEGWPGRYGTASVDYRVNLGQRACVRTIYCAEAAPAAVPGEVGPGALALYLGCRGVEMPETTWMEPCLTDPEAAGFAVDPANHYWQFSQQAIRAAQPLAAGRFLQQFPDLIEGLDILAAMRGTDRLLFDLLERPQWIHACLRRITDLYFYYYDVVYDLIRDDIGGVFWWCYAPGRLAKLQCDFSAMISPAMFREFMEPVLREQTERLSYNLYHLDGVAATCHLDCLLSLPRLQMIQWTPGAGQPDLAEPIWWPMYHRILDAGKKLFLFTGGGRAGLASLKREFGAQTKQMIIGMGAGTVAEAHELMDMMLV